MKPKTVLSVLVFLLVFAGTTPALAQERNAGFVQGLWYDRETLLVGKPIRIYAAIRNNTGGDLTGTVEFYVGDDRLERNNVAALDNRIVESWADWTPSYGTSTIKATLSRTELSSSASGTKRVEVVSALTEDVVFVDHDTDGDGIGDATDGDDDGDGVSDVKEKEEGTDPLDPDDPPEEERNDGIDTGAKENTNGSNETGSESPGGQRDGDPDGLEQYLADSRAKQTLSAVTDIITNTRQGLDAYRDTRNDENAETAQSSGGGTPEEGTGATSTETSLATTSASGAGSFGDVQRSAPQDPPPSFWTKVWNGISYAVDRVYTLLLFLLSLYLWHPIIVQLSLLALILFVVYRLAKHFGKRKNE